MKRTLALLLALMMVLSVVPASALATDIPVTETPAIEAPAQAQPQLLAAAPDGAYTRIEAARLLAEVLNLKYHDDMAEYA